MNLLKLAIATLIIFSLSHAEAVKITNTKETKVTKMDTNNTSHKKMVKPAYLDMDEFTVVAIDGKKLHTLSTKKGYTFDDGKGKITLLVMWAAGCKSCPGWLRDLNELQKSYPKKLKIVAVEINNMPIDKLKEFTKKNGITYSMLSADQNKDFASQALIKYQFGTKYKEGLPFTVALGYQGQTNAITVGISKKKEYKAYIAKLIKFYEEK